MENLDTLDAEEWNLRSEISAVCFALEQARKLFPNKDYEPYLYLHERRYKRVRKLLYQAGKLQSAVMFAEAEKMKRKLLFTTIQDHGDVDFQYRLVKYTNHVANKLTCEGPVQQGHERDERQQVEHRTDDEKEPMDM